MIRGRMLALVPAGGLSGVQRTHVEMAVALRDLGWDVHTLIPGPPDGLDRELDRNQLPHHGIPRLTWAARTPLGMEAVDPTLVDGRLCEILSDLHPDVALTQSAVAPQLALAAQKSSIPHAWYVHEFCDLDHDLVLPEGALAWGSFMQTHSTVLLCNSHAVRSHFFPDDEKVAVIPYVVEMPNIEHVRPASSNAPRIGIIGTLQDGKGQSLAISALRVIQRQAPNATLHLFGSGAPSGFLRLKRLAADEKVMESVIFHGFVADRSLIYGSVDIVLVASRAEAYGRVPDEAALVGIPVVYVPTGGLVERLRDGRDGIAATSTTPEAITEAVVRAVDLSACDSRLVDFSLGALRRRYRERNPHDEIDSILCGLTGS